MKLKVISHFVLGIMFFIASHGKAQNVLIDGSFDTTTVIIPYSEGIAPAGRWNSFKREGVDAYATVKDGVCDYQITNGGSDAWEVQLEQAGFPILQGHYYRLSYDVKADADRYYGLFIGEYSGSWTSFIGFGNYWQYATPEWQHFSINFYAWDAFDYHKFSFEIGGVNVSMYFDHVLLEDLGSNPPIGILGTALNGWDTDVDMLTSDGITYTLSNVALTVGFVKFRQNDSWDVSWGGSAFPTGTATLWGDNIPVYSGSNYNITFNRETGEYSFECIENCHTPIEFTGTATSWDSTWIYTIPLWTNDGITYALKGQRVFDGEARFRQADKEDVIWGSSDFPSGTALERGDAIPLEAGIYNITFNAQTLEYSFTIPEIGIIGTALSGWDEDIDMQTSDGKLYTLMNYEFKEGEVKFRQDNSWDISWGGFSFPTGAIWQEGPNIQVMAGTYNVTLNRMSGEYYFEATNCPDPGIICPGNVDWANDPGMCGAYIKLPEAIPSYNCGGNDISVIQTGGLPSGSFFPVGTTTNTYSLTNAAGKTVTCSSDIVVYDWEAPSMDNFGASVESSWPPNHMMIPVRIDYTLSDNCEGATYSQLWVVSSENDTIVGAGKIGPDYEIIDEHHVLLKAERSGRGWGRDYYVVIECWDESRNFNIQYVRVSIPHDQNEFARRPLKMEVIGSPKGQSNLKSAQMETGTANNPMELKVWPNPSAGSFNVEIQTSSEEAIEINITDTNGRLISKLEKTLMRSIQLGEDLNPGIYILNARQGNYHTQTKVVKR